MFMFKYPSDINFENSFVMDTAQNVVNNPYKQLNEDNPNSIYSKGSDARNRRNEVLTAGAEFDSDLALLDYQNQYNSPTEKAKRMREAGLNPDLLGISDASDSSGLSGLSGSAQVSPDVNPASRAMEILGSSSDVLNSAFDMYSKLQGIRGQSVDNDISKMNLDSLLRKSAEDFIGDNASTLPNADSVNVFMDGSNTRGLSKRSAKRYRELISRVQSSLKGQTIQNKTMKDFSDSRFDLASSRTRFGYSDNFEDMFGTLKAWNQFLHDCEDISAQAGNMKSQYDKDYYSVRNGVDQAYYDNKLDELRYDNSNADLLAKRNAAANSRAESIFKKAKARLYQQLDKQGLFGQILMGISENGLLGKAGAAMIKKFL